MSKVRIVWMTSRSLFSCARNCATQRTPTLALAALAWQYNIHVGHVGGVATGTTIDIMAPPALPAQPVQLVQAPPPALPAQPVQLVQAPLLALQALPAQAPWPSQHAICRETFDVENTTEVDFPASVNTTVLMEVSADQAAGCCVAERQTFTALVVLPWASVPRNGTMTVFLEAPNMPPQQIGVAQSPGFSDFFSTNVFLEAEVVGLWKLIVLGSTDAAGWSSTTTSPFSLKIFLTQCVWLTWLCQERWWKEGRANERQKCFNRVSRRGVSDVFFYDSGIILVHLFHANRWFFRFGEIKMAWDFMFFFLKFFGTPKSRPLKGWLFSRETMGFWGP